VGEVTLRESTTWCRSETESEEETDEIFAYDIEEQEGAEA